MNLLILSIVEIVYILYIFNFFKTRLSFNHPFEIIFTGFSEYLKHPIDSDIYENKICPLGHILSHLFSIYILIRLILIQTDSLNIKTIKIINCFVIGFAIIISLLLNLNAFIYLIPVLLFEFLVIGEVQS